MTSTMPIEDSLHALLNCNLCKKETDDLKALPCQHTACLPCVRQLKVVRRRFTCDICLQEHCIPNGGFENLPDSLVVKQLRDLLGGRASHAQKAQFKKGQRSEEYSPSAGKTNDGSSELSASKQPSSKVSLMLAKGGFGSVPSARNTAQQSKSAKKKQRGSEVQNDVRPKEPEVTNAPSADEIAKLREEITDVSGTAKQWLVKAVDMLKHHKTVLRALPERGRETKQVIFGQQKKIKKQCQEKLKGLDKAMTDRMEESKSTLKIVEPCADHMKNVLDSIPDVKLSYSYYNRNTEPELITRAQDNIEKFENLNKSVDSLPIVLSDLEVGDYVRLVTLKEAELARQNRYSYMIEMPSQKTLEHLTSSKVTYTSIGRYRGEGYFQGWLMQEAIFPEQFDWRGPRGILVKCQKKVDLPYEGDKVKVKSTISVPHFGWHGFRHKRSCGVLKTVRSSKSENDLEVIVNFPENSSWKGLYSEIELGPSCGMAAGDEVWVSRSIPEPSRGWAGVNGSSVGKVKSVEGAEGQEEVTVDFPECKDWVGLATELELVRDPKKGDKVQVKLSVTEPKLGWGGSNHDDVGDLREIIEQYDAYGRIGNVKFPGKPEHPFLLDEIEPVRYRAPSYEDPSHSTMDIALLQYVLEQRNMFNYFHAGDDDDYEDRVYYDSDYDYDDDDYDYDS